MLSFVVSDYYWLLKTEIVPQWNNCYSPKHKGCLKGKSSVKGIENPNKITKGLQWGGGGGQQILCTAKMYLLVIPKLVVLPTD